MTVNTVYLYCACLHLFSVVHANAKVTFVKVQHLEHPISLMLTTGERHQKELGKDSILPYITVLSERDIRIKSESCFLD